MSRLMKRSITGEPQGPRPGLFPRLLTQVFGTGLGTGYLPFAQGAAGSALWVTIWWFFIPTGVVWNIALVILLHLVSVPLSAWGERMWGPDPGRITIDEFAGQQVVLLVTPHQPVYALLGFALFRIFDTFKSPIVRRRIETLPGGWGVTLDDTIAGVIGAAIMMAVVLLI